MASTVKKWKTDNSYAGKAAVTNQFSGSVWAFDTKGNFIQLFKYATKGITYGIASGRGVEMSNGVTYWLITLKNKYKTYEYAYVANGDFYFSQVRADNEAAAKNDAQTLFNNLVASDKKLAEQINARYLLLGQMKAKKIDVTAQTNALAEIVTAFQIRQNAIKNNPLIKLSTKVSGVGCDCPQIGLLPIVWGAIIGGGLVLAGVVVYYFLKPEYNTSQVHSKYLQEHEAELRAALGDEGFEKLQQAVDGEIKEAAQEAYDSGKDETTFGMIKNLGLMAAGIFLFSKLQGSGK